MKHFLKYLPLYALWFVVAACSAYNVMVVQKRIYEEHNGAVGTVTWVQFDYRFSDYHCGIVFPDGTRGEVNAGSRPIKVGDSFTNEVNYDWYIGISGTAYCVLPQDVETKCMIWCCAYMLTVTLPLIALILCALCALWDLWDLWIEYIGRHDKS